MMINEIQQIITSQKQLMLSTTLKRVLTHAVDAIPIGDNPIQELQLKWQDIQDANELKHILSQILEYPSTDLAKIHENSNKLGALDLKENSQIVTRISLIDDDHLVHCNCCGFLLQKTQLSLNERVGSVNNIGLSTFLYFETLINLIILMVIMFLVYGIFALVTNIIAATKFQPTDNNLTSNQNILIISLSSKQANRTEENETFYYIQCWLGLVFVIIWGIFLIFIKYMEKDQEIKVSQETISASDFSVVMHDVPTNITQQELQEQLNQYYQRLSEVHKPKDIDIPFEIAKMNKAKPFYLNEDEFSDAELDKIHQEQRQKIDMFAKWILQRKTQRFFSTPETIRKVQYENFQNLKQKKYQKYTQLTNEFLQKMKNQENLQPTTTVFVTFKHSHAKELMLYLNGKNILNVLRKVFCCEDKQIFTLEYQEKKYEIDVRKSPQPEDIIWTNIGQTTCEVVVRKFITYTVTLIILGGSFGIIYILSLEQNKQINNAFLSFLISIAIAVINVIIQQTIRGLTSLERQYTQTQHQASLALKSVLAQLINSILIPIVVNHYIEANYYDQNGLAFDIFLIGLTNAFLLPFIKIFEPYYYFSRILVWWFSQPKRKLYLDQQELNGYYELIPFEVGYEYIYIVNMFLFICFYASLQPIVIIFGIAGFVLMYWAQKYTLFYRMRRPFPGNDLVNTAMYQLIYFGPIVFSIGNLTWSNLLQGGFPDIAIVPNIISLCFAVIIWLLPYKVIFALVFEGIYPKDLQFEENRIYLSSEYDRLNPSTSADAVNAYVQYIKAQRQSFKNKRKQELLKIQELFLSQVQKGQKKMQDVMPFISNLAEHTHADHENPLQQFDKIFGGMADSQKIRPQTFYKSLYKHSPTEMGGSKRIRLVQNWKIPQKKQLNLGMKLTYDLLIDSNKKNKEKQPKTFSRKKVGIKKEDQDSMESLHSQEGEAPLIYLKPKMLKITQSYIRQIAQEQASD